MQDQHTRNRGVLFFEENDSIEIASNEIAKYYAYVEGQDLNSMIGNE